MSSVYVVGTFDTKGGELRYVAALIAAEGVPVTTVDVGTGAPGARRPDRPRRLRGNGEPDVGVPAREVAAHHPDGADAVFTGDRGRAVAAWPRRCERSPGPARMTSPRSSVWTVRRHRTITPSGRCRREQGHGLDRGLRDPRLTWGRTTSSCCIR